MAVAQPMLPTATMPPAGTGTETVIPPTARSSTLPVAARSSFVANPLGPVQIPPLPQTQISPREEPFSRSRPSGAARAKKRETVTERLRNHSRVVQIQLEKAIKDEEEAKGSVELTVTASKEEDRARFDALITE
jgi:hypothetical protein